MPNFDNGRRPGLGTPAHEKAPAPSTVTEALSQQRQQLDFTAPAEKTGRPEEDQFATLRAQFAQRGHRLERAFHGENQEPTYYAERWGLVRHLPTIDAARRFLEQIGGRL